LSKQITNRFGLAMRELSQKPLDLHTAFADTSRLVPMDLSSYDLAGFQHHFGNPLALSPPASTVPLSELSEDSDSAPCRNSLDLRDLSDDLKAHRRIVPELRCVVNVRKSA
jgi:hypothetical protein